LEYARHSEYDDAAMAAGDIDVRHVTWPDDR